jgi:MinD-like ATPase involved in chromosome partitioning or flagellar assembly
VTAGERGRATRPDVDERQGLDKEKRDPRRSSAAGALVAAEPVSAVELADSTAEEVDVMAVAAANAPMARSASAAPNGPAEVRRERSRPSAPQQGREHRAGLSDETLRRHRGDIPTSGWRRAVYTASGHLINPGPGPTEIRRSALRDRVTAPLRSSYRVATISIKGGVGKTTVTACSGFALAEFRGDQVAVVDANPDAGTLADRLTGETSVTIRDLLANLDDVSNLTSVQGYMSLAGRLKILASDQDPAISESLGGDEYASAIDKLCQFFNLVITDCGTGMVHPTMRPTLDMADRFVIVGGVTIDAASRAGKTLDWLKLHGYEQKARDAVIVLNQDRKSNEVDVPRIVEHFAEEVSRHGCHGGVVLVPHDPHLATGGRIEFGRLKLSTQDAFTEVAALIADGFGGGRLAAY